MPEANNKNSTLTIERSHRIGKPAFFVCLALFTLFVTASHSNSSHASTADALIDKHFAEKRALYQQARKAQISRDFKTYRQLRNQLSGYPLASYLDYYDLLRRLRTLPTKDVDHFLSTHPDDPLASRLRKQWLSELAKRERWSEFLYYYAKEQSNTGLECQHLEARIQTGDESAYNDIEPYWNVHFSQNELCDDVFKLWFAKGGLSDELIWRRIEKTISAGNTSLAQYLIRQLKTNHIDAAETLIQVHRRPHLLANHSQFQQHTPELKTSELKTPELKTIVAHGFKRWARADSKAAFQHWEHYDAQLLFEEETRHNILKTIAKRLLIDDEIELATDIINRDSTLSSEALKESLIREHLKRKEWTEAARWIQTLPEELKNSERWQYWQARATEETQGSNEQTVEIYTELASERSYFGFLASDRLNRSYKLQDTPLQFDPNIVATLRKNPFVIRARELFLAGEFLEADREWYHLSKTFNEQEYIASAELSHHWGWHRTTISSLAKARHWDDLQKRFPLAYNQHVIPTAYHLQLSPLLVFAIARQESAFAANARSPAGAMGLMQIMPGTAKQTASKAGLPFQRTSELLEPKTNITIGSRYINELLEEFQGNRILATAAYNAGPNRVKRWLKETGNSLEFDLWIEVIPYRETRKYVQNVLAYSVIYGYRTGTVPPMITQQEGSQLL